MLTVSSSSSHQLLQSFPGLLQNYNTAFVDGNHRAEEIKCDMYLRVSMNLDIFITFPSCVKPQI